MKDEIINSIAKEIHEKNRTFREQVVMKELNEKGVLFNLYHCFKEQIFSQTTKNEFAAIYSHTVIFVLLSASLFNLTISRGKDLKKILLNIIRQLSGTDSIFHEILESINGIDIPEQLSTFIIESKDKLTGPGSTGLKDVDILPMLYERFLKHYETVLHKKTRYYYTPGPVVSFMVYCIHNLLKEKLNIDEGLADLDIRILDPAFGTGNFLAEVIQLAIEEKTGKYGEGITNPFIQSYLSRNIYGFEVMLPLYVLGYLNLLKVIKSFCGGGPDVSRGQFFQKEPPLGNLYLTDTLKNVLDMSNIDHQKRAGIVKTKTPITVIFCNPPYSKHSLNKGEEILKLVKDYLHVKDRRIEERNIKGLQDDYVKFFRYAQWKIDQNGSGVMGFITNNSYLENPTFRGMRYSLLKSFDEIYILDLHGAAWKIDKNDEDENLFGVGPGIAIAFFIKLKRTLNIKENLARLNCKVFYSSMKGSRESKFKQLEKLKENNYKAVQWERVFPMEDFYLFTPGKKIDIYQHFIKLTDIFPVHSVGIVTARDKLTIQFTKEQAFQLVSVFSTVKEEMAREVFTLREDTRDWEFKKAQQDIIDSNVDINKIVPILYRPFDIRYTYYTGKSRGFICMPRPGVMRHMLQENIGLISVRYVLEGAFSHCFVTDTIIDGRITTSYKGITYIFPLYKYVYPEKNKWGAFNIDRIITGESTPRHPNINSTVFTLLHEIYGIDNLPSSSQIFYYIYAILNSGIYREIYRDHLKIDFPRIPFTSDFDLFIQLSSLGERLAAIHLMKSSELMQTFSKFAVSGDNLVARQLFKPAVGGDGRVYINDTQYFSNIPKELWEYYVCGYQVLKKWLKDRKNRKLTPGEIRHYIKICRSLQLTIKYREEIDGFYSQLEKTI